jgi:hypothetical protein
VRLADDAGDLDAPGLERDDEEDVEARESREGERLRGAPAPPPGPSRRSPQPNGQDGRGSVPFRLIVCSSPAAGHIVQ